MRVRCDRRLDEARLIERGKIGVSRFLISSSRYLKNMRRVDIMTG